MKIYSSKDIKLKVETKFRVYGRQNWSSQRSFFCNRTSWLKKIVSF